MVKVRWEKEKSKQITINGSGGNATLHFSYKQVLNIPNAIWPDIKEQMAGDIMNLYLIVLESTPDKEKSFIFEDLEDIGDEYFR